MPSKFGPYFPFRRDNRKPNGTWDAPDATRDNIKGSSVDHYDPVWPRWRQTPPPDTEGEFVSDEPFFDIDEITQKATLYPPGTPLVDRTSTAIPQAVNGSTTWTPATCGDGGFSSGVLRKGKPNPPRICRRCKWPVQHRPSAPQHARSQRRRKRILRTVMETYWGA